MKPVSIKDIAEKANVSITTVSFIVNGKEEEKSISKAVVQKVKKIVEESGYRPNQAARSLRTGASYTIGLIVEDISNSFFSGIAKLIEDKAFKKGYKIIYASTENNVEKALGLINTFRNRNVDAYIISPMRGIEQAIKTLIVQNKPVVFFDRKLPGVEASYVGANHFEGIYQATSQLLKAGKRHIAFVTVDIDVPQVAERYSAYKKALADSGIAYQPNLVHKESFNQSVQQTTQRLRDVFALPNIDAVVFATNYLAISGLKVLKAMGKAVDDRFSVIGYDDHEAFELHSPSISSIQQPVEDIAENIIKIALEQLTGKNRRETKEVILPTTLIKRI